MDKCCHLILKLVRIGQKWQKPAETPVQIVFNGNRVDALKGQQTAHSNEMH